MRLTWLITGALLLITTTPSVVIDDSHSTEKYTWGIDEALISKAISDDINKADFPDTISLGDNFPSPLSVTYTIDQELQDQALKKLKKYNPDYSVFVAIEADTGKILAMAESTRHSKYEGNLILRNTYPAASVSKIITALAAINENKANINTIIPFNGKSTSLYKNNVFLHKNNKWTRKLTLRDSFAKSVNSVFGRLGAVDLGGETLMRYAEKMGFNGHFNSDFKFTNGQSNIDTADKWQVAKMASGYTNLNTLSPLHGAVLAATTINGGYLIAPTIVDSLTDKNGLNIYQNDHPPRERVIKQSTADQLEKMMEQTVKTGSARSSFRGFRRSYLKNVVIGGKTGSLSGSDPKGKYDWFVGFAKKGQKKIAYAALCINVEKWYVKSSRLAGEILSQYFKEN